MHGCREGIVRALAHVAMIVRMNGIFGADHAAQNLNRTVGDHLVGVHVRLGAGTCLPHDKREMVVQFAVDHLASGLDHCVGQLHVELT